MKNFLIMYPPVDINISSFEGACKIAGSPASKTVSLYISPDCRDVGDAIKKDYPLVEVIYHNKENFYEWWIETPTSIVRSEPPL